MKKKSIIPIALVGIGTMLSGVNAVEAKEFTIPEVISEYAQDGEYYNNTYIIGNYLFRDGLSAKEMFMAGDSVEDKANAVIYHLHTDGKTWSDAFTDQPLESLPEKVDIRVVYSYNEETGERIVTKFVSDEMVAKLKEATYNAKKYNEAEYTADSWKVLTDAKAMSEETDAEIGLKVDAINAAIENLVYTNKPALVAANEAASKLVEAEYTVDSWKILDDAKALPEKTNEEIGKKATAINEVITTKLVFANLGELETLEKEYEETVKNKDIYEVESYNEFFNTYAVAASKDNETYSSIANKINEMKRAFKALKVKYVEKSYFDTAVRSHFSDYDNGTLNIDANDYTPASWAAYKTALDAAVVVNNNTSATGNDMVKALNDLNTVKLVFANQQTLDDALDKASNLNEADYATITWNALSSAKTMTETTNAEVGAKATAINDAINALVTKELEKALSDAVMAADEIISAGNLGTEYSFITAIPLSSAVTEAKKSITKNTTEYALSSIITEADVKKLTDDVNNAMDNLEFHSEAELNNELAKVNELKEVDYESEAWRIFNDTLASIKKDDFENNAQVESNLKAIQKAIAALEDSSVLVPSEKADELKNELLNDYPNIFDILGNTNRKYSNYDSRYIADSFTAYTDALDAVQALYVIVSNVSHANYADKKISDVDNAISNLLAARDGLEISTSALPLCLVVAKNKMNVENYETIYTEESRNALETAIANAEAIIANSKRTYDEVQASMVELRNVELVADMSGLTALLDDVYGMTDGVRNATLENINNTYTSTSFMLLSISTSSALNIEQKGDTATVEEITNAVSNLTNAKAALVTNEIQNSLSDDILSAEGKSSSEYTVDSYTALTAALTKVKGYVTASNGTYVLKAGDRIDGNYVRYTQAQFVELHEELQAALEGLDFSNEGLLNDAITAANTKVNSGQYSEDTVTAFNNALALPEGTYAEINAKITAITGVTLVFKNQEALDKAKESARLDATMYDLTEINTALALNETTYEEIEAKINAINTAVKNVVPKNLSQLEDYKTLNDDNKYTAESYEAFKQKCEEIIANGSTETYTLIQKMLDEMKVAEKDLVLAETN